MESTRFRCVPYIFTIKVVFLTHVHKCIHVQFLLVLDSQSTLLEQVDFVICVGGDGTLLYTSSMFQVLYPHSEQLLQLSIKLLLLFSLCLWRIVSLLFIPLDQLIPRVHAVITHLLSLSTQTCQSLKSRHDSGQCCQDFKNGEIVTNLEHWMPKIMLFGWPHLLATLKHVMPCAAESTVHIRPQYKQGLSSS